MADEVNGLRDPPSKAPLASYTSEHDPIPSSRSLRPDHVHESVRL